MALGISVGLLPIIASELICCPILLGTTLSHLLCTSAALGPKKRILRDNRHIIVHASMQANVDKQARKLEEIRAQPHAPGPQGKAAKQKKIDKLDKTIKMQMAKDLGGVRMKQTFLVSHSHRVRQHTHLLSH